MRDILKARGILVDDLDTCCVFCFQSTENSSHLFDECLITSRIWTKVAVAGRYDSSVK